MGAPVSPAPRVALFVAMALATAALQAAALATSRAWPAHAAAHLALYAAAGAPWLLAIAVARALPRAAIVVAVALAVALRAGAVFVPPVHSDDHHRYAWDGEVQRHGFGPYAFPASDPALAGLRGPTFEQINHRDLPTIYPPLAQLAFRALAHPGPRPVPWRAAVVAGDLATAALLGYGAGPAAALTWLLAPLVLFELDVDLHLDGLAIPLLCAALVALARGRRGLGGAALGLAIAVKPLPLFVVVALRDRRVRLAALLAIVASALPFCRDPVRLVAVGEFGRRWRANDGAFAPILAAARATVDATTAPGAPLRLGPLAPLVSGRDRDVVYADELAGAIARLVALALFGLVVARAARTSATSSPGAQALHVTEAGIGAFLVLTPVLHPWYALWALPAVALGARRRAFAWLWLVAAAPLGHLALLGSLAGRGAAVPLWARLVEHVPPLAICAWTLAPSALGFPRGPSSYKLRRP